MPGPVRPLAALAEMRVRMIYDPDVAPHIKDLIERAKDGEHIKDIISDYMMGVVLLALGTSVIGYYEARLFQVPFVRTDRRHPALPPGVLDRGKISIRVGLPHAGRPFLDPDGLPMTFHGYLLIGGQGFQMDEKQLSAIPRSSYHFGNIHTHPNYRIWANTHLWQGGPPNSPGIYRRIHTHLKNHIDWHTHVNGKPYVPGLGCAPQPAGYADEYPAEGRRGKKRAERQLPAVGPPRPGPAPSLAPGLGPVQGLKTTPGPALPPDLDSEEAHVGENEDGSESSGMSRIGNRNGDLDRDRDRDGRVWERGREHWGYAYIRQW